MTDPPKPHRISDITYAIPFGRYVGSNVVSPGADEVLVGREGQRAYFIDLLISSGRQGAYLVTGRRGSGKTSFVKHCIAEYEARIFQRFLRNNVGRGLLDRFLVLLSWFLILLGGLLLSELAQILGPLATGKGHRPLLWLLLLPLGLLLLYPWLYARAVLASLLDCLRIPWGVEGSRFASIGATVVSVLALPFLWFYVPGLGSPAWTAGVMFAALGALYLGVQATSFRTDPPPPAALSVIFSIFLAAMMGRAFVAWLAVVQQASSADRWLTFVGGGLAFFGAGLVLRGHYQHRRMPGEDVVSVAMRRGGHGYFYSGLLLLFLAAGLVWCFGDRNLWKARSAVLYSIYAALFLLMASTVLTWVLRRCSSPEQRVRGSAFRPQPVVALTASIILSWVIALHLAHPVISTVLRGNFAKPADEKPLAEPESNKLLLLSEVPGLYEIRNDGKNSLTGFALFRSRSEEFAWLCLLVLGFTLLHLIQYEWILRPFVQAREEGPLDPDRVAPWDDIDPLNVEDHQRWRRHRDLAELTLPWAIYSLWLPTLAVAVNLGFDAKMGAGQVIQAMLAGLREKYHGVFTSWRSGLANLGRFVGMLGVLTVTTLAGEVWFGLPTRENILEAVTKGAVAPEESNLSACKILKSTRDSRSPVLADHVCDLGETWFHLLYFNFVPQTLGTISGDGKLLVFKLLPHTAHGLASDETKHSLADSPPDPPQASPSRSLTSLQLPSFAAQTASTLRHQPPQPATTAFAALLEPVDSSLIPRDEERNQGVARALAARWTRVTPQGVHWCLHHTFLFLAFLIAGRWVLHKLPVLPYRETIRRIDDLLDAMSARTRVTSSPSIWEPARWIYSMFTERVKEMEREPLDPRTVELAFLQILEDMGRGGLGMPGVARNQLSLPAPEVTFIFDELDKLGTRIDPDEDRLHPLQQEAAAASAEHDRAIKLRALLSDLKNILAAAPARFIFIGGRNLHDEWLADQTSRQPLLTNIFTAEVYLPSLMTDRPAIPHSVPIREVNEESAASGSLPDWLDWRVEQYVAYQYLRAQNHYQERAIKRLRASFGLGVARLAQERFIVQTLKSPLTRQLRVKACLPEEIQDCCAPLPLPEPHVNWVKRGVRVLKYRFARHFGKALTSTPATQAPATGQSSSGEGEALLRDFVCFLTHRSMGNPKRLKELLAQFIRPTWQVAHGSPRWELHCRHVIRLRDGEVFRIQLIAAIYRHLAAAFEARMVSRDDKLAVSVFFLTDFLFKFHRRAFSWSNLERVDELAHIHRAPDMRDIQEEMVDLFSERVLHRVLNGMYSFRFRSDVASEVEFLSRRSAAEMAALNFTLDESQSLKAQYFAALHQHGAGKAARTECDRCSPEEDKPRTLSGSNPGLVAGLGELYEFDQEFETARHYYRQAIELLDAEMTATVGAKQSIHLLLAAGEGEAAAARRTFLPWAESRLRLMLQIGMTYEIARNLERAEAEYRTARTLARAVVKACIPGERETEDTLGHSGRLHTLKHLSILFQPLYAQAWVSEKIVATVDTSVSLIEQGLWEIRQALPFVSNPEPIPLRDPSEPAHANFSLTLSQLHNKAADLYYFKGRQPVSFEDLLEFYCGKRKRTDRLSDGYLLRAHYHYAVSLHELRRFLGHRVESSRYRLSIGRIPSVTLQAEAMPDFLWRAAAGTINDMAEATLARLSFSSLLKEAKVQIVRSGESAVDLKEMVFTWLGAGSGETRRDQPFRLLLSPKRGIAVESLANWLGAWVDRNDFRDTSQGLVDFVGPDPEYVRLAVSLELCRVGARFFSLGGYLEDAARELLQVASTVTRYLWWLRGIEMLAEWHGRGEKSKGWSHIEAATVPLRNAGLIGPARARRYWYALADMACDALEEAAELFTKSRNRIAQREANRREFELRVFSEADPDLKGDSYLVGDVIPPEAVSLACSVGLWLASENKIGTPGRVHRVAGLIRRWRGASEVDHDFTGILVQTLRRHRFPLLNRLYGLKLLVDSHTLSRGNEWMTRGSQVRGWLEEMMETNSAYAAPFHFTPFDSGTTCAFFWLRNLREAPRGIRELEHVFRMAERDLRVSEEMYTLRRAFYESISDLYYLYDDFNDRQIHFKHAIQMAGAEMTCLLRKLLEVAHED